MIENLPLLFFLSTGSAYSAMILGLVRFRWLDKGGKALALLCIANGIELTVTLILSLNGIRNLGVENIYRPVELSLIAAAFWHLTGASAARRWLPALAIGFVLIWFVDAVVPAGLEGINANMAMVQRIFGVLMSVMALYLGLNEPGAPFLRRPLLWMGTAVLVYCSGSFLVLGFSNELVNMGIEKFIAAWQINWALLLIANLLYIKGMLCKPQLQT